MKYLAAILLFFVGIAVFPFNSRFISSPAGLMLFFISCLLIFFSYRALTHKNRKKEILLKSDLVSIERFAAGFDKYFNVASFVDFFEIDDDNLSIAIGVKKRGDKIIIGTIFVHRESFGLNSCSIRAYNGNKLPGKDYYSTVQEALFESRHYFASMVSGLNEVASVPSENEEAIYERAANEIETDSLKKGVWAKSLAEADGNEIVAKARYVRMRSQQLLHEHQQQIQQKEEQQRQTDEADRQVQLREQQKAYDALPKGTCPNCTKVISLSATECPACQAVFTGVGAWKPVPL